MEARDSRSKIRPLPIDDIGGDVPQDRQPQPRRRWLPLIVIVIGAIAFGVIARGLGPTQETSVAAASTTAAPVFEEPEPTSTTEPPPPSPQPLRQLLPSADSGLRLVAMTTVSARVGEWVPGDTAPEFNATISQPQSADYNADGTRVAVHSRVRDGSVVIDSADGGHPIYIQQDVKSGIWHPTDSNLFAWSEYDDGPSAPDGSVLKIGDLSGYTNAGLEALVEITLDDGRHDLLAWGEWGFVTSRAGRVFLFDADGLNGIGLEGSFFDATPDGTLLLARVEDEALLPYLLNPDRTETALVGLDIGVSDMRLTEAADWVLAVTYQADGHTSILARTVHTRSTRLTSIDETARIVDVVWDDRFVVLQEDYSNDLVFKDWNTGAEFRLPIEFEVGAVDF